MIKQLGDFFLIAFEISERFNVIPVIGEV